MYLLIRYKCLFPVALSCFSGVSESIEICLYGFFATDT